MASSLDHIEKTLADAYRREIDQEENIWRSLPFFGGALALELGAISQIVGHLPPAGTGAWRASLGCLTVAGLATLTAFIFLMASIFPSRFSYISSDFWNMPNGWTRTNIGALAEVVCHLMLSRC